MTETAREGLAQAAARPGAAARDHAVGAALGAVYVAWLLGTARGLGFARDEGFYFQSATTYAAWFKTLGELGLGAFSRGVVDAHWSMNHEHPSLMKSLFALSWMLLHEKFSVFGDASTAFRFPGMVMGGLALWVTYVFGARVFSRTAGFVAALLLALMPHLFYNAHLACFDVPIMTMWLLSVYVFWRADTEGGLGWAAAFALVYGLTLETKHNAWILPAVFVPCVVFRYVRAALGGRAKAWAEPQHLLLMTAVSPLVFVSLWPWLWFDTAARISRYVRFHVHHDYYNIEFLGRNYFGPPSPPHYAPVLIAASVPTVTLLLFAVGAQGRGKESWVRLRSFMKSRAERAQEPAPDRRAGPDAATDLLLALAFAAPLAVFFLPRTPIFGGTKHWLPAYPFLALFAGHGFERAATAMLSLLERARASAAARRAAPYLLGAAAVAGPLAVTVHSHPFGLSTYVPLVGGTQGGADLGLNRQFWGYTTESVAPWLAAKAPPNATVFIHDTAWPSWERLIDERRLRPDLRGVGTPSESAFALVQHELHMNEVDYSIWVDFGGAAPAHVLTHDGVPIVSVYRRR